MKPCPLCEEGLNGDEPYYCESCNMLFSAASLNMKRVENYKKT
jgi:hypothetical protein